MDIAPSSTTYALDDQSWLGSAHGTDATETITLLVSAFDAEDHYPDGFIRSGTPLGKITASGKYAPYDDAVNPANGTEALAGFLYGGVHVPPGSTNLGAALLVHGKVRTSRLPVAVDAAGVADVAGRIRFI